MDKALIILRGLPGSGKTTLAHLLSDNKWPVFSIDDYFTDPVSGKYHFRFDENHIAYRHCAEKTAAAMKEGVPKIFVHNTFTLEWEMEPYFSMAASNGYQVHVLTVENRHHSSNVHGISDEQLKKMAEKYKVLLY